MHPPRHVCKAIYDLDHNLRLCWLGQDFERSGEGCFGVIELRPRRQVETAEGIRKTLEPWFPYDIQHAGDIFNKFGGTSPDFDRTTQAPILICTVSPQWHMHTRDVYGSRLVSILRGAKKSKREHYLQQRREIEAEARQTQTNIEGIASELADGIMHARKHHAGERVVMARKHYKQKVAEREKRNSYKPDIVKSRLVQSGHL